MLFISRSMDVCISSLCSIDNLLIPYFFHLSLPPLAPNILFCFSNNQGAVFFFFLFLLLPPSVLQGVDSAQDRDFWSALVNAAMNLLVP